MRFKHFMAVMTVVSLMTSGCASNSLSAVTSNDDKTKADNGAVLTLPQEEPSSTVLVKSIIGNELTVVPMPLINREQSPVSRPQAGDEPNSSSPPDSDSPDMVLPPDPSANNQNNAGPEPRRTNFNPDSNPVSSDLSQLETKTIILPAGVPILSINGASGEVTEVGLSSIQANQRLRLWENEQGNITMVQVMATRNSRSNNNNQSSGGFQGGGPVMIFNGPGPGVGG